MLLAPASREATPSEGIQPSGWGVCPTPLKKRRWSAAMTPRDAGLRADDAVASH
eukprot:COSAG06_NODE_11140_length_1559_cov_1.248630_1_plen_53_part_10